MSVPYAMEDERNKTAEHFTFGHTDIWCKCGRVNDLFLSGDRIACAVCA